LFDRVKGKEVGSAYSWKNQFRQLNEAITVFGRGNVSTHVIVGLGETEKEATQIIQRCVDLGVLPALFAFTPIRGTKLETHAPPSVQSYRRIQLARYLIASGKAMDKNIRFDAEGHITSFGLAKQTLDREIESGLPFRTCGCPDCNRPFYNEKPGGPFYNYPRDLRREEIEEIKVQLS